MITFNRRGFLAGSMALGTIAPFSAATVQAADLSKLTLWGPPVGPSVVLAHLVSRNRLSAHGEVDFQVWRNPDQLRAGFASATMLASTTPSYVAANMANRGTGAKLLNVMTWGLLYLMSSDGSVKSLSDLAGKTVAMPFKNDMPDLVTQHIMRSDGMVPGKDVNIAYVSSPIQALKMLISGKVNSAIIPEPAATGAMLQGMMNSVPVRRVLSLQDEWGRVTGRSPRIPQAGMMVAQKLLDAKPELVRDLQMETAKSVEWTLNNPASAGKIGAQYMGVKARMVEKSIPFCNLAATPAVEARADLEHFFTILAETNPKIIGGKLPDDDFYIAL